MVMQATNKIQGIRWQPPRPKTSILGSLADFRRNPATFIRSAATFGPIVFFRLAIFNCYLVSDPELIAQVLVSKAKSFGKGKLVTEPSRRLLGNGLATSDGELWLRQRRLAQGAFHHERITDYAQTMADATELQVSGWQTNQTLNINEEMTKLTLDIVCRCLFGSNLGAADKAAIVAAMNTIEANMADVLGQMPPKGWLPTRQKRDFWSASDTLKRILLSIIDTRRQRDTEQNNLLSMLLAALDEDGSQMTNQQLLDEVMTLFLAGHETVSGVLTFAFYEMSRDSKIEVSLRAELQANISGVTPTLSELARLVYMNKFIDEMLRYYPPGYMLNRRSLEDVELGGYIIPKGAEVIVSPLPLHESSQYFDQPEKFNPDRWNGDMKQRLPKYAYFPFGAGQHICIGQQFALMNMKMVLATTLLHKKLRLLNNEPVPEQITTTLRPGAVVRMQVLDDCRECL